MVARHVRVYIEGGAQGRDADQTFRRSWKKFLDELHQLARQRNFQSLEVVRGKGRALTYDLFRHWREANPQDLCVLVVDAEGPWPINQSAWDRVRTRTNDNWPRPAGCTDDHLYLMVQSVETWLITDHDALSAYFKRDFDASKLPPLTQVHQFEQRSKADVENALVRASAHCKRGPYRHGDGNAILEKVRPANVRQLPHGDRLFTKLAELIRRS